MHKTEQPLSNRKKKIATVLLFSSLNILFVVLIAWNVASIYKNTLEAKHKNRLETAVSFCEALFDESFAVLPESTDDDLNDCKNRLTEIADNNASGIVDSDIINNEQEQTKKLLAEVDYAFNYRHWLNSANAYLDENGVVKESITESDLSSLSDTAQNIATKYQESVNQKLSFLKSEFEAMQSARNAVNNLFTAEDHATVRRGVTRGEYNEAKKLIGALKQTSLKQTLNDVADKALPVIEEQERIARELAEKARREREEEQRKIAASWSSLNISPFYINQVSAGLLSGCEAASLLMALNYKGYLRGMNYLTFANNMPRSDTDPNQGFYLSMSDLEPRDEAHWIAPAPLASYGARSSGASVINATGWSLDQLDNEVKNGNPVIIYLTFGFNNPKTYSKGVPKNLHVLVLSGYNSYTGVQQFYDPWPVGGVNPSLSKARTNYLYAASGYRALVVR